MVYNNNMRIITDISELECDMPTAITVGNFDGVHLGHQQLIKTTKQRAKENNLLTTVVTFDIHPHQYFFPTGNHLQILDPETKISFLKKYGVDLCVVLPFSQIYNLDFESFVGDVLIAKLNMKYLVEGSDFHFGRDTNGNIEELKLLSKTHNFGLDIIERFSQSGIEASSTFIRKCISKGEYKLAEKILGHRYFPKNSKVAPPPIDTNVKLARV